MVTHSTANLPVSGIFTCGSVTACWRATVERKHLAEDAEKEEVDNLLYDFENHQNTEYKLI